MDVEQEVKGAISRILNIAEEKVTMNLFIGDVEEFELTSVAAFVDMIKSLKK